MSVDIDRKIIHLIFQPVQTMFVNDTDLNGKPYCWILLAFVSGASGRSLGDIDGEPKYA